MYHQYCMTVMKYQQHHCNRYCLHSKKTKHSERKVCRFGFPRVQNDKITIRSVMKAVAGRKALKANSRLYDLPRSDKERMTNNYNAATMLVWNSNMDIQYIDEKTSISPNIPPRVRKVILMLDSRNLLPQNL